MRRVQTAEGVSEALRKEVEQALAHPNEIFGYARYGDGVQWTRLDKATGGIQPKTLGVLAARPKVGKSMLAAGWVPLIAEQAMNEGQVVRVVTLEMSWLSYQRRMAAILAQIRDPMNIRRGTITPEEVKRYNRALDQLASLPIEYLSNETDLTEAEAMKRGGSVITFDDVNRFVRARGGEPTYWWLLDHIGLLSDLNSDGDVTKSIYYLANKLAGLAHQVATGLVITHLTRASVGAMPTIESIAGSDQVGRNADSIMLLSRPFMGATDPDDLALIEDGEPAFLQVYSRDEGGGLDVLLWDRHKASFSELVVPEGVEIPMPKSTKKKK